MTRPTDHLGYARTAVAALAVLAAVGFLFAPVAVAQTDTGTFGIDSVDAPGEASVGQEITVEATVENTGGSAANGTVRLDINGSEVDTAETGAVDPNETTTVDLTYTVDGHLPDEADFTVSIGDAEQTGTFTVNRESQFDISITDGPPDSVSAGETVELTAEIENTGGSGETTVSIENDQGTIESRSIELGSGEATEETFSYSTTDRDLGMMDLVVSVADGSDENRSVLVGFSDEEQFAAARTSRDHITVTLAESAVGPNGSVPNGEITLGTDPGTVQWTWNISAFTPENGLYQHRLSVPGSGGIDDTSLVGTTVEVSDTELSDEADLHTVESASFGGWTEDGTLYLPVETVGVTNTSVTDVSLVLAGETVDASLTDPRTVEIDLGTFREEVAPDETTADGFETDGAPVGSASGTSPEIRYLHGEIVLWHPHIEDGVEHTVTVHSIDDAENETSTDATAVRDGAIPVPNDGEAAGANMVTVSVGDLLGEQKVEGPGAETASINATLVDGTTIETDRSLEALSVSSVLIGTESGSTYLSGEDLSIDGERLQVSGVTLEANGGMVELATDAGIVAVQLSPPEGGSIVTTVLFALAMLVGAIVTTVGGFLAGQWKGIHDKVEHTILAAVIIFSVVILAIELVDALGVLSLPVPFDPWGPIGAAVVALFAIGYAGGDKRAGSESDEMGQTGTRQKTTTRHIDITDGTDRINDEVEIEAVRGSGANTDRRTTVTRDGWKKWELPKRKWRFSATLETENRTYTSDPIEADFGRASEPIKLEFDLPDISVTVQDEVRDIRIPDASVRLEANETTETKQTGDGGQVRFDPPPEAETVALVVDHEKYQEATVERELPKDGLNETIELSQRPGQLRVQSRIDGVATGGMNIKIVPEEPALERLYSGEGTKEATTDESGEYVDDRLLVGRYRVSLAPPKQLEHLFETRDDRAVVDQPAETVTLEASFTWSLSAPQRDRIDRIRTELRDVTAKSGVDVAIPQYYASVVETVLDAVESFPERGHYFAEIDADPDTVADATLDAAAEATETISEAMSTKRNLDLFTACSDMSAANVRWTGDFHMKTLIERLNEDPMAARRAFAARADEVADRIDAERGSLSEIAPAREMLERVDIDGSGRGADGIVSVHVAILLLDAIEELFEHRELTERLSRTVF